MIVGHIGGSASDIDTGDIQKSLRFAASRSTYLSRTITTDATSTYFAVVKRGNLGAISPIFDSSIKFNANDTLTAFGLTTTAVFRDPTSWLFIHVSNGGLFVNGVSFGAVTTSSITNPRIGFDGTNYFDGYIARCGVVGGTSSSYTNFGYQNTEINEWVSKSQSAVKAVVDAGGANSFMLDFDDGTSLTTLGYDKSSKGNNWTLNNHSLTSGVNYDWMGDVPGNSFATLNAIHPSRSTLSNGNLTASGTTDFPTITPDSETWYFERGGVSQTWTPPAAFPSGSGDYNFGQRPWQSTGPTGGQKALNQRNLTAIPSALLDPTDHHIDITVTKSGDTNFTLPWNASTYDIFFEIKRRDAAGDWYQIDGLRGYDKILKSNGTAAETTDANVIGVSGTTCTLKSTLADGTYIISATKAGLSASRQTNTDGSTTSTVSRNVDSGFAIVTYTGTGTASVTIGHGLGKAPACMVVKERSTNVSGWNSWQVYHNKLVTPATDFLRLNETSFAYTGFTIAWANTNPTSAVFSVGFNAGAGINYTSNYVAYCYADSAIQKSFSYTGNGSVDGTYVNLGFECGRFFNKRTDSADGWYVRDSVRDVSNVSQYDLRIESPNSEATLGVLDLTAIGAKFRTANGSYNASGGTYVGHAWASVTGKYSNAR